MMYITQVIGRKQTTISAISTCVGMTKHIITARCHLTMWLTAFVIIKLLILLLCMMYCVLYTIFSDVYHQLFCHTAAAASVARHIHWRPAAAGVAGTVWR